MANQIIPNKEKSEFILPKVNTGNINFEVDRFLTVRHILMMIIYTIIYIIYSARGLSFFSVNLMVLQGFECKTNPLYQSKWWESHFGTQVLVHFGTQGFSSLWNTKDVSLWNTKQPKAMEALIKNEITLEHNTPSFWVHFTHTNTDGEGLKMKDGVGWGGWGGWGGVNNVCLDIHLHDDLFLLIASTVPCNTDALRLIDVVGLGWWGGGDGVGWGSGVLITSVWTFIYLHDDLFLPIASTVPCNTDALRLIDVVGLGRWGGGDGVGGGWGGVNNVCLDIHLHDDIFLLIASTVPCNRCSASFIHLLVVTVASNLLAMAYIVVAMASNLLAANTFRSDHIAAFRSDRFSAFRSDYLTKVSRTF